MTEPRTLLDEADAIALSALQHFVVCPRQCALIHLEGAWLENARTAEGRVLHERVDASGSETRNGIRRVNGLLLHCRRLGLSGRADVVEFHAGGETGETPFPVEYKRGRMKKGDEDKVQLCAQALCLEEMLEVSVPEGALFYGENRRRLGVIFDRELRRRTEEVVTAVRQMLFSGHTPLPPESAPCGACSLQPLCRPDACRNKPGRRSVSGWIAENLSLDRPDTPA